VRVVFLRRQKFGGIATYTELLAQALGGEGVEAVVDDTDDWIPNQTGPGIDREVSVRVRAAARGFDLVHAFGYRAAWACSEALGKGAWVYTAHDMPKTTHRQLVTRLNEARRGVCSSSAVFRQLETAKAARLALVRPGVPTDRRLLDRAECRRQLGIESDTFLMVAAGRFCVEHSLETAIYVADALPYFARLFVSGQGECEPGLRNVARERVTICTSPFSQQTAIAAADVVVVPSTVAGFSFTALEAMLQGVPVAMRRTGGLPEMATDHQTAFYFDSDEELLDLMNHLCHKRELLSEVGRAGRQRALAEFDIARTAREYAEVYRLALG
jgi:glycosyltransferase involved in cell wall biosynthesis